jgi:hypothetical protein
MSVAVGTCFADQRPRKAPLFAPVMLNNQPVILNSAVLVRVTGVTNRNQVFLNIASQMTAKI